MNVNEFISAGSTYSGRKKDQFVTRYTPIWIQNPIPGDFFRVAMQNFLDCYDMNNPPTLGTLVLPISAMCQVSGVNLREEQFYKDFIRGYKKNLESKQKTCNLTCPIFLDHGVQIFKRLCSK